MSGLFAGTSLERPVTCEICEKPLSECACPRDATGRVMLPSAQTAVVQVEKHKKGKIATTISGLNKAASNLPVILTQLKSTCGAGGTIEGEVIIVQGDHRQRVAEQLKSMGYKVIER